MRSLARWGTVAVYGMVMVLMAASPGVADNHVTGTVFLDGAPLAGVEVFLGQNGNARYVCTGEDGSFSFEGSSAGVGFLATGPAVSEDCENQKFIDDAGNPLVVASLLGPEKSGDQLRVERLPRDHPGFFHQLKTALYNCYDHSGGATADILEDFGSRLDEAWAAGQKKLSQEAFDTYHNYAGTLAFILDGGVCAQD